MAAAIFTAQTDFIKLFSLTTNVPSLHELNHRFRVFYTTDDTYLSWTFQENGHFEDEKLYLVGMGLIGHFRVPKTLTLKMRLGAQPSCENEFYLRENEKWFPYQRLHTYPSFETEARGNSEMAY